MNWGFFMRPNTYKAYNGGHKLQLTVLILLAGFTLTACADLHFSPDITGGSMSLSSPCHSVCTADDPCMIPPSEINFGSANCTIVLHTGNYLNNSAPSVLQARAQYLINITTFQTVEPTVTVLNFALISSQRIIIGNMASTRPLGIVAGTIQAPVVEFSEFHLGDLTSPALTVVASEFSIRNSTLTLPTASVLNHRLFYLYAPTTGETLNVSIASSTINPSGNSLIDVMRGFVNLDVQNSFLTGLPYVFGVRDVLPSYGNITIRDSTIRSGETLFSSTKDEKVQSLVFKNSVLFPPPSLRSTALMDSFRTLTLNYWDLSGSFIQNTTFTTLKTIAYDLNFNNTIFENCLGDVAVNGTAWAHNTRFALLNDIYQNVSLLTGGPTLHIANWTTNKGENFSFGLIGGHVSSTSVLHASNISFAIDNATIDFNGELSVTESLYTESSAFLRSSASTARWTFNAFPDPISNGLALNLSAGSFIYNVTRLDGIAREAQSSNWTLPNLFRLIWSLNDIEPALGLSGTVVRNVSFINETLPTVVVAEDEHFTANLHFANVSQGSELHFFITGVSCPGCLAERSVCNIRRNCTCLEHWNGTTCNDFISVQGACSGAPPGPQFTCLDGVWTGIDLVQVETIEVPREQVIVIQGNLTVSSPLIVNGPSSTLNVTGCLTLQGGVQVTLTMEDIEALTGKTIQILQGQDCASLLGVPISVITPTGVCESISTTNQQNALSGISVLFSIDKNKCKKKNVGVIVGATVGSILLLVAIIATAYGVWRLHISGRKPALDT